MPALRESVLDIGRVDLFDAPIGALLVRAEYWMDLAHTTWQESAAFLADVAWQARRQGRDILSEVSVEQACAPGLSDRHSRTRLHLLGLAMRFDFRRVALEGLMQMQPRSIPDLDVYSRALYAFALLGQSKQEGLPMMEDVLAGAGDDPKTLHALLHGLWLGDALPDQAELMLGILSRPPFRSRTDPVALYREARALRRLCCYGEALATLDRALEHLPSGELDFHSDLVRERALVTTAQDLTRIARSTASAPKRWAVHAQS